MEENMYQVQKAKNIVTEVKKSVVGKDEVICKVLMAILADGHVLLDDIPGVGKTTLANAFATVLGLNWKRVQFTPDVMPSDITGFNMYNRQTNTFEFKEGAAMCNMLLADEINRTSPKTQSALLQVMEEGQVSVDGNTYKLPDPFIVLATQNPVGSIGTQKLPESQMDRFMIRLSMGYPTVADEIEILKNKHENNVRNASSRVLQPGELKVLKEVVDEVYVDDSIFDYVARIAKETRSTKDILLGISPRGSIATIAMAKASAFLRGNSYVLPSDIHSVLVDVCAHRIVVNNSIEQGIKIQQRAILNILKRVPVPAMDKRVSVG